MFSVPTLPFFVLLGVVFGALAAAIAYIITYTENRKRFLRPGQDPRRMALETAAVTFAFFFLAAIVLAFVLTFALGPPAA